MTLVATGRLHLMRIPYIAVCTRRRRSTTQFESRTALTLPLVLHQPMHTVRQQPARKEQQLATAAPTNAGGSAHNTVPRRSNDSRSHSSPEPNHCCTHNRRASSHQIAQFAHAKFRPTAATPNRSEQLGLYKNCGTMAAHDASKAVRASVTTIPSFLNQNGLMYGVIRRQDIDKRGLRSEQR